MTFFADLVKKGRVGVETMHLTEKLCALFLAVNFLSAALGVNSFAYTKTAPYEFDFGWKTYNRVYQVPGSDVKLSSQYSYGTATDCLIGDPCDNTRVAGTAFFVMNLLSLVFLAVCVIITLEMAIFRFTPFWKKLLNVGLAVLAALFSLVAWANYMNSNDCSAIAENADKNGNISYSSSIWYCVTANVACFFYAGLCINQNIANWKDKQDEDRTHADPIQALPPAAPNSRKHKDHKLSEILSERISTPLPGRRITGDRIVAGDIPPKPNSKKRNVPARRPPQMAKKPSFSGLGRSGSLGIGKQGSFSGIVWRSRLSSSGGTQPHTKSPGGRVKAGSITKQRGPPPLPPRESLVALNRQTTMEKEKGGHKRRASLPPTPIPDPDAEGEGV